MKEFHKIIKKIGEELNIKVTLLSDNWTTVLEKDNMIHYITGYQFDLNNHGIGNIMDDKGLFYDLLKYKDIPIIEQKVIMHNYDQKEIINYFNKHNKEVIVKANISNAGKEVFKIVDEKELFKVIDQLLLKHFSISICPYYQIINEYRVVLLNNEVRLIFGKEKPIVYGNGKDTVKELAIKFNNFYKENFKEIINPNYIPKINEKVELSFKFNLSHGARSFLDIPNELKNSILALAKKTAKSLNITFASIDIIHTKDNQLMVLEANSGVTLNKFIVQNSDNYNLVYSIYRDAIKMMFNL